MNYFHGGAGFKNFAGSVEICYVFRHSASLDCLNSIFPDYLNEGTR